MDSKPKIIEECSEYFKSRGYDQNYYAFGLLVQKDSKLVIQRAFFFPKFGDGFSSDFADDFKSLKDNFTVGDWKLNTELYDKFVLEHISHILIKYNFNNVRFSGFVIQKEYRYDNCWIF